MNVVIYARYSSHNQTEQSIEGQLRVCREYCEKQGMQVKDIYVDRATSASKNIEKRTDFLRMIKDAEKQNFEAVIVYKLDRFSRSRYDMATYKYRLRKYGVQLISATENISQNPEGIILESVLEGMAEFYSAELSQKIKRGHKESAYKHRSVGGTCPLGYKLVNKEYQIDHDKAPLVVEAFQKYADGVSITEICRSFNARGLKTTKNGAFGKSSFSKMFRNEKYIGVYQYHDYRVEDAIPRIIDQELWDRVQKRLGEVKHNSGSKKAIEPYLLSGKCFCGHCGSRMNGDKAGSVSYYRCYGKKSLNKNCDKKIIRKDHLEYLVAKDAMSLLTDERIEEIAEIAVKENSNQIESTTNIPTIKTRLRETQVSLDNLTKAIESGIAPDTLLKRMLELEKEKKSLEKELKEERKDVTEIDKYHIMFWLEQFRGGNIDDPDFRRILIDLFVNSVTVYDDNDKGHKIVICYNLSSMPEKTYRLDKQDGTLSIWDTNANMVVRNLNPNMILIHAIDYDITAWELVSPQGKHYLIGNLSQWVRDNSNLFDSNVKNVVKQLVQLKYSLTHDGKHKSYKGWTIVT